MTTDTITSLRELLRFCSNNADADYRNINHRNVKEQSINSPIL